jgi:hypothetical protein
LVVNRKTRLKLVAFVLGLGFAVLFAEIAGRMMGLMPAHPSASYIKLTQEVGRLPAPYSRTRFKEAGEFDITLEFNAMGFRDPKTDFPDSFKGKKILAIGDSFATAWEVLPDQRWTEHMHRFRTDWSILNIGMRNWGIDQTYLNLVNYPLKHKPDIVLLMFFVGNDVSDNYRDAIIKRPMSFNDLQKMPWSGYKNPYDEPKRLSFPRNVNSWLRLHSVVYRTIDLLRQFVQEKAGAALEEDAHPNSSEPPATWGVFRVGEDSPEWQTAWNITEILLQEIKKVTQQRNTQLMVVIAPLSPLIEPEFAETAKKKGLLDPSKYDLTKPARRLLDFGKANDILMMDLTPGLMDFRKEQPAAGKLFFPKDGHFTPLGNCVVASQIVNWIDPNNKVNSKSCLQ